MIDLFETPRNGKAPSMFKINLPAGSVLVVGKNGNFSIEYKDGTISHNIVGCYFRHPSADLLKSSKSGDDFVNQTLLDFQKMLKLEE